MLITLSFKKSLIVEQFQGNYLYLKGQDIKRVSNLWSDHNWVANITDFVIKRVLGSELHLPPNFSGSTPQGGQFKMHIQANKNIQEHVYYL